MEQCFDLRLDEMSAEYPEYSGTEFASAAQIDEAMERGSLVFPPTLELRGWNPKSGEPGFDAGLDEFARTEGMTFDAWRNGDFIPLSELLQVLGEHIENMTWVIDVEVAPGWAHSERLTAISATRSVVPTDELLALVADGIQVIDGDLFASARGKSTIDVTIRSIRGDEWEIRLVDSNMLASLATHFPGAQRLDGPRSDPSARSNEV